MLLPRIILNRMMRTQLVNIVGRVLDGSMEHDSTGIVQFESSDIINLLELYFSKQNLEIGLSFHLQRNNGRLDTDKK